MVGSWVPVVVQNTLAWSGRRQKKVSSEVQTRIHTFTLSFVLPFRYMWLLYLIRVSSLIHDRI
jgi:hypothetical protein